VSKPSPEIMEFMSRYKVDSDEIWQVHGNSWVIKHKALERVAAEQSIIFDKMELKVCDLEKGLVVVLIGGRLGDRAEQSFGEASPKNNKNAYPVAMAEKRAKDRVILKLLNVHGTIYSEEEADDFKQDAKVTTLPKKDARGIYEKLQREVQECQTREQLKAWMAGNADRIKTLPEDWQDILRIQCGEMMDDLKNREAA